MTAAPPQDAPLDALIAERVLGWKPWRSHHGYFNVEVPGGEKLTSFGQPSWGRYDPETGEKLPEPQWWQAIAVSSFSDDLELAMQVVEKLWGAGWEFDLDRNFVRKGRWMAAFNNGGVSVDAEAETAPLAICLAAMKTLA